MTPRMACVLPVLAGLVVLVGLGAGACGDGVIRVDPFQAMSGSRLKLEWHRYEDGTLQPDGAAFYDIRLHARCTARRWIDDELRCVPDGDEAVYVMPDCSVAVGVGRTFEPPAHFIGHDHVAGVALPARGYLAGEATTPITQHYERHDGGCVGPFSSDPALTYYEVGEELAGAELVAFRAGEIGGGRLGLRLRETADGVRVPLGLRDRELDLECRPAQRPDPKHEPASVACEPTAAAIATGFHDPGCEEGAIVVADSATVPASARVVDAAGCARYHGVGAEVPPKLYRRVGDACVATTVTPGDRIFAVGPRLDLARLDRTLEDAPGRRLQRIIETDDELRFVDDLLFDTATRSECRREAVGEVARCVPAQLATASVLYLEGCALEVRVAELPETTCERVAFATTASGEGRELHAIGARITGTLFQVGGGGECRPYGAPPGIEIRALGPALAPETFIGAVSFGER